ncbi:MAG: type 4a pilus biogenesis protein PilO [Candidatus Berkelbacteria bacterium]
MKHYTKNLIMLLSIIALTYCALIFFVVSPTITGIHDSQKKLENGYSNISQLQGVKTELEKWEKNKNILDVMVANVDHLWPAESSTDIFSVKLKSAAKSNGISISSFSFSVPTEGKAEYSLEGTGSYSDIFNFVESIEKIDRFNTIPLLTIANNENQKLSFKILGEIYYGE